MSEVLARPPRAGTDADAAHQLDRVFFALSDATRRDILHRLSQEPLLVSELAGPYDISLQAVSRHIQVLVRADLVRQERSGRVSLCSLDVGPIFAAAVWINHYSRYWQAQFETLAAWLEDQDTQPPAPHSPRRQPQRKNRKGR